MAVTANVAPAYMYPFHDLNVLLENSLTVMLHFPAPVVSQSLNIYCMSSKTDLPWEISKLWLWSIYLSATLFWRQETTQDEHRGDDDCGVSLWHLNEHFGKH